MFTFILLFFFLFFFAIVIKWIFDRGVLQKKQQAHFFENDSPYFKKNYLLTKIENNFYKILEEILQGDYYIFPQIHLSSLIGVKSWERYQKTYLNKIDRKSVDYVICDRINISPLLVIELDDKSHYRLDRQDRDQFVNEALESVGLKFLRVRAGYSYNFEELKSQILQELL